MKYSFLLKMALSLPNFTKLCYFDILLKTSAELFVTSETEEIISTKTRRFFDEEINHKKVSKKKKSSVKKIVKTPCLRRR